MCMYIQYTSDTRYKARVIARVCTRRQTHLYTEANTCLYIVTCKWVCAYTRRQMLLPYTCTLHLICTVHVYIYTYILYIIALIHTCTYVHMYARTVITCMCMNMYIKMPMEYIVYWFCKVSFHVSIILFCVNAANAALTYAILHVRTYVWYYSSSIMDYILCK